MTVPSRSPDYPSPGSGSAYAADARRLQAEVEQRQSQQRRHASSPTAARPHTIDHASPLRLELPDPALVAVYRRMTAAERLAAAFSATALVRARIEAHLRGTRPEWSEAEVQAEVARRWLHGGG